MSIGACAARSFTAIDRVGIRRTLSRPAIDRNCEDDAVTDAIFAWRKDFLAKSVDTGDLTRIRAEASSRGVSLDRSAKRFSTSRG
jgi:hypothetical protein